MASTTLRIVCEIVHSNSTLIGTSVEATMRIYGYSGRKFMDHFLLCALTRHLCKALPKDHYLPQQLIDLQITFQTIGTKLCNLLMYPNKV